MSISDTQPLSKTFLEHVVKAPSQYDFLCRRMAQEILELRAQEFERTEIFCLECRNVVAQGEP